MNSVKCYRGEVHGIIKIYKEACPILEGGKCIREHSRS
jgi:hypothetical protein